MGSSFEEEALRQGILTQDQVQEALRLRAKFAADGLDLSFEEVVLKKGWITRDQAMGLGTGARSLVPGFEILRKLGQGGMGAVYQARQLSMDRIVALKVLLPQYAQEKDFVGRFLREARAVAKLNHPNIVCGYDAGEAGGSYYFAMEYVEGETLDTRLKRLKKLPWKEAVEIVRQVAKGLAHAHAGGIIHRDIKPSNIILPAGGEAKLLDLGMARSAGTGEASLTLTGHVVGTPQYMSPEQAQGEKSLDIRADLYSLGVTLYEMLSGAPPFTGANPMAILHKHVHEGIRWALPGLPPALLTLGHRLTERNRSKRIATPAQLLEDLDRLEQGAPLPPRTPVSTRRIPVARSSPKMGIWIGAAAGLTLLFIGAVWVLPSKAPPLRPQEKPPVVAVPARPASPVPSPVPAPEPAAPVPHSPPHPTPAIPPPEIPKPVVPTPAPVPVPAPVPAPAPAPRDPAPVEPPPFPAPAPEPARDRVSLERFLEEVQVRVSRRDWERIDVGAPSMETAEGKAALAQRMELLCAAREVWRGARAHLGGLQGKTVAFETRQGKKVSGKVEAVANGDTLYVLGKVYGPADLSTASLAAFHAAGRGPEFRPEEAAAFALLEGDPKLAEDLLRKGKASPSPALAALLEEQLARRAAEEARVRAEREAEALVKAGRLEEAVERHPSTKAAASAKEKLAATARKVLFRWDFEKGAAGWSGKVAPGSAFDRPGSCLQGDPQYPDSYRTSSVGRGEAGFAWNPKLRLRFDYKGSLPLPLKVQIHPDRQEPTGTIHSGLERVEPGVWKTFDRALGDFEVQDRRFPEEGRRINTFYIMSGFGDRIPDFFVDNIELYLP